MTQKKSEKNGLPEIKVDVKTPPSSGGLMNWGPAWDWLLTSFKKLLKRPQ
ncbi:hypothetical protein GPK34_08325 [Secundilactobacillus kimchicus]|nr:hypothetical protein [Secundilactobacillus kimchicus]MBT9672033.1 hypothetical protein [Secundilactobacillus kimchicus]